MQLVPVHMNPRAPPPQRMFTPRTSWGLHDALKHPRAVTATASSARTTKRIRKGTDCVTGPVPFAPVEQRDLSTDALTCGDRALPWFYGPRFVRREARCPRWKPRRERECLGESETDNASCILFVVETRPRSCP
jgi:hypothetical protein